jgi:predicted nucleotidyltransferase
MCPERFEAVTKGLIEHKKREVGTLCERRGVERLALFGSASWDDFDPEKSDLDFSVEFQPMTPHEHTESYFGLFEDLEDLFGRCVDLVEIGAVRNPYLRREIEERKQILVGRRDCGQPEGVGV